MAFSELVRKTSKQARETVCGCKQDANRISPFNVTGLTLRTARVIRDRPRFELATLETSISSGLMQLPPMNPGSEIAVAAGSRGVANIARITRATIDALKAMGIRPFIFPAMGSHGGATAEGQREVLASNGITEDSMGCPIRATMDVVELDSTNLEHPLYLDAFAAAADGILLVNRIKPHTDFHGPTESGLVKMSIIGAGKQRQAETMHNFGVRGLRDLIPLASERLISTGKIWGGIGIVENAYDETALVEIIAGNRIQEREPQLLDIARANMPSLPVDAIDVLIIDETGKNISGSGMDTNVIGRWYIPGEPEPETPRIRAIAVCDLTDESHGNAVGLGLADVITKRLSDKISIEKTNMNAITSGFMVRAKTPLAASSDAEAYRIALRTCTPLNPGSERVMRIRNTLHLSEVQVSAVISSELEGRDDIEWLGGFQPAFDDQGNLRPWSV